MDFDLDDDFDLEEDEKFCRHSAVFDRPCSGLQISLEGAEARRQENLRALAGQYCDRLIEARHLWLDTSELPYAPQIIGMFRSWTGEPRVEEDEDEAEESARRRRIAMRTKKLIEEPAAPAAVATPAPPATGASDAAILKLVGALETFTRNQQAADDRRRAAEDRLFKIVENVTLAMHEADRRLEDKITTLTGEATRSIAAIRQAQGTGYSLTGHSLEYVKMLIHTLRTLTVQLQGMTGVGGLGAATAEGGGIGPEPAAPASPVRPSLGEGVRLRPRPAGIW